MLPDGWTVATVADACSFQNGHGFGPDDWTDHGLPIIRIQNLNGGKNFDYYAGDPEERWLVRPGQMLFAWAGTRGVSFGPCIWRGPTGVLNQHIFKVSPYGGIDSEWLFWTLRHITDRIEQNAHGFKATLLHVKKSDIERQQVLVPPLREQEAIGRALVTWEQAIRLTERLLANSHIQKQAWLRALLTPQADWKTYRLGSLFSQRVEVGRQDLPLLSITREDGVIPRDDVGRKDTSNEDKSKYLRICPGDIGYNTMRMWQGVSALSSLEGIVSPAYTVAVPTAKINGRFAAHLFKSNRTVFDFYRYSQGLVSDTWSLKFEHFSRIEVAIPHYTEQERIVRVLDAADTTVATLQRELRYLQKEKSALMQQLLTGKRRLRLLESGAA